MKKFLSVTNVLILVISFLFFLDLVLLFGNSSSNDLQIAEENGATNEDYKKIFSSYAIDWCSQKQSYFIKNLLEDVHSLDKVRTNAVLSSTDKFYEVYNIKPTDKMFVSINDRVAVW